MNRRVSLYRKSMIEVKLSRLCLTKALKSCDLHHLKIAGLGIVLECLLITIKLSILFKCFLCSTLVSYFIYYIVKTRVIIKINMSSLKKNIIFL